MARDVKVNILGDSRDFSRAVGSAERDASRLNGAFGRVSSGAARMAGGIALGVAGVVAGGGAMALSFVRAAEESQQVSRQTGAVLESMGASAWTSATQVEALSRALSNQTGVDDELIQSGQNVLLTFGEVQNRVGEGNDIFDRATRAALDMSTALGTDMNSAAMQVGKALNDPIRGLTQLRRSGIQFTQAQEDQIRTMVEAGDVAGAQRVMLAELERQFGGSAEAQATASQRLSTMWGNLQEDLGAKLLPIFEKVVDWLGEKLPRAIDVLGGWFDKVKEWWPDIKAAATPVVEAYVAYMKRLIDGFKAVVAWVQDHWPEIQEKISNVLSEIGGFITTFIGYVQGAWQTFGDDIIRIATGVWEIIQQVVESAMRIVNGIINVVMGIIHGDWEQAWNGIKGILTGIWDAMTAFVRGALDILKGIIGGALNAISETFHAVWQGIYDFLAGLLGSIVSSVTNAINRIREALGLLDRYDKRLDEVAAKAPAYVPADFIGPLAPGQRRVNEGFVGPLPGFHTGGIYNAPGGRREGLAWLESGERIIPRGQSVGSSSGDGGPVQVQVFLDGKVVVDSLVRYNKSNGPIQVQVA